MEGKLIKDGKTGDVFFTYKADRIMTALATYYGKKILTERYTAIDKATNKKLEHLTKVTIQ